MDILAKWFFHGYLSICRELIGPALENQGRIDTAKGEVIRHHILALQRAACTGDVIERWNENGAPPDARGIADEQGRLMVLMVHNTDLPDPWEREGEDKDYFYRFSPDAYAVGINILLYAMTH